VRILILSDNKPALATNSLKVLASWQLREEISGIDRFDADF